MKNPVGNADADAPFRGNPAFVVALERALPAPVLSEICAQLHEDVLAVVVPDGEEISLHYATRSGSPPGACLDFSLP